VTILGDAHQVKGTDIEDFDITDREETLKAITGMRPAWVINAAAYTQVDRCERGAEDGCAVNGKAPPPGTGLQGGESPAHPRQHGLCL